LDWYAWRDLKRRLEEHDAAERRDEQSDADAVPGAPEAGARQGAGAPREEAEGGHVMARIKPGSPADKAMEKKYGIKPGSAADKRMERKGGKGK